MAYLKKIETLSTFSRDVVSYLDITRPVLKEKRLRYSPCPNGFLLEEVMDNAQLKKLGVAKAVATVIEKDTGTVIEVSYEADQTATMFWGGFAIFVFFWVVGNFLTSVKAAINVVELLSPLLAFFLLTIVQISIFEESVKKLKTAVRDMLAATNIIIEAE